MAPIFVIKLLSFPVLILITYEMLLKYLSDNYKWPKILLITINASSQLITSSMNACSTVVSVIAIIIFGIKQCFFMPPNVSKNYIYFTEQEGLKRRWPP